MKRKLLVAVPLLMLVALLAWMFRPKRESLGEAYVSEQNVTLWSSVAQVREQIDVLHYGERVDVLSRHNENVRVRTASGADGWVDGRSLMEPLLWQRSAKLLADVRSLPVQARGRTKVQTNLRVEPGRNEPRLYQFVRGAPVEIVGPVDDQHAHVFPFSLFVHRSAELVFLARAQRVQFSPDFPDRSAGKNVAFFSGTAGLDSGGKRSFVLIPWPRSKPLRLLRIATAMHSLNFPGASIGTIPRGCRR